MLSVFSFAKTFDFRASNSALQISYKGMLSLFLQWKRNTKTFCDAWRLGTDGDVEDWKKQTAALIWPRTVTRAACCSASHHQSNDSWIYNEAYGEMIEDVFYSEQKKKVNTSKCAGSQKNSLWTLYELNVKPKKSVELRDLNIPA